MLLAERMVEDCLHSHEGSSSRVNSHSFACITASAIRIVTVDRVFHFSLKPPQSHLGKSHSLLGPLCQLTEWLHLHIGGIFIGSTFILASSLPKIVLNSLDNSQACNRPQALRILCHIGRIGSSFPFLPDNHMPVFVASILLMESRSFKLAEGTFSSSPP